METQPEHEQLTEGALSLEKFLDKPVSYKPLDSKEEITLSPRLVQSYLSVKTKRGHGPSKADVVRFLQLCRTRMLDPWVGDAYLVGYDSDDGPTFNLITSIQALLKRAELHKEYAGLEAGVIVLGGDDKTEIIHRDGQLVLKWEELVGAWCRVYRKDREKHPTYVTINRSGFDKGVSLWRTQAPLMLEKCAKAAALREAFPTTIGSLYISEEIEEVIVDAVNRAADLKEQEPVGLSDLGATPKNGPRFEESEAQSDDENGDDLPEGGDTTDSYDSALLRLKAAQTPSGRENVLQKARDGRFGKLTEEELRRLSEEVLK